VSLVSHFKAGTDGGFWSSFTCEESVLIASVVTPCDLLINTNVSEEIFHPQGWRFRHGVTTQQTNPRDGGSMFLRTVGVYQPSQPSKLHRRQIHTSVREQGENCTEIVGFVVCTLELNGTEAEMSVSYSTHGRSEKYRVWSGSSEDERPLGISWLITLWPLGWSRSTLLYRTVFTRAHHWTWFWTTWIHWKPSYSVLIVNVRFKVSFHLRLGLSTCLSFSCFSSGIRYSFVISRITPFSIWSFQQHFGNSTDCDSSSRSFLQPLVSSCMIGRHVLINTQLSDTLKPWTVFFS
jgi:hypothetical protein